MRKPLRQNFTALTTDLYEVTMAYGYWKAGVCDHEAAFHVTFRHNPFGGQFTVACGLATAIDFLRMFHFTETEIAYLASQRGNDGKPLFDSGFLDYLRDLRLTCDIDAIPEGTLVFPNEPLIRVCGPVAQCQLLETTLLNILHFERLIATKAARQLRQKGHEMIGVRRDSGNRVAVSIEARRILDKAGFTNAKIVCSGELDEHVIADMKQRGARIDMWGVGTKLTTGQPDAALGGIYKLGAVRHPGGQWQYRIKLSDEAAKTSCPGLLQVRRFQQPDGRFIADAIYETGHAISEPCVVVDLETEKKTEIPVKTDYCDLLVPVFRRDQVVYQTPNIEASREHARQQLDCAPREILRLKNATRYRIGLERPLHELRSTFITRAKEQLEGN